MAKDTNTPTIAGIRPSEKLVLGSNPLEQWKLFKQRWTTYAILTNLDSLDDKIQVALFLHVIDDDALRTYNGFVFDTPDDQRKISEVISKFDEFAIGEQNITFERFKFNQLTQSPGEQFETFLSELRQLAKSCSFCDQCRDSFIRDRIVIGIREPETRQDLLKVRNLTSEKCIDIYRSAEDASTQSRTIQPEVAACNTNQKGKARYNKKPDQSKQPARTTTFKSPTGATPHQRSFKRPTRQDYKPPHSNPHGQCGFCRYSEHNRIDCPARRATCSSCQKIGNYHKMCRSKDKTGGVDGVEPGSDWCTAQDTFLGHVQDASGQEWMAQINVEGRPRSLKLDTGASVTVIGEGTGVNLRNLRKSDTQLRAVGGRQLEVLGFFTGTFSYRGRSIQEKLYVVKGQTSSLLSRNACVKLGLVARIDNVQANPTPNFETEFPELFQGLGKLEETCSIKSKKTAVPLHIFTPRKIDHSYHSGSPTHLYSAQDSPATPTTGQERN